VSEALEGFEIVPGRRDQVRFLLRAGCDQRAGVVSGRIAEVAQKMCRAYRPTEMKVLVSRADREVPFRDDPHPSLMARGDLFEYGRGRYGLGPRLVRLIEFFDGKLRQMADRLSAEPYQFPSLVRARVLDRCQYLRSFPHALTLAAHLREDLEAIQDFARNASWFKQSGITRVELQVVMNNEPARRLYREMGWVEELVQMVWQGQDS
jgi:hypothetical protein